MEPKLTLLQKIIDVFRPKRPKHPLPTAELRSTNSTIIKNPVPETLKKIDIEGQTERRIFSLVSSLEYNKEKIHQLKTGKIDFSELDHLAGLPQHRREAQANRLEKQNHYYKRQIVNEEKIRDLEKGRPKYNDLSPAEKQVKIENLQNKNKLYEQQRRGKSLPTKEQSHIDNLQKRKKHYIKQIRTKSLPHKDQANIGQKLLDFNKQLEAKKAPSLHKSKSISL